MARQRKGSPGNPRFTFLLVAFWVLLALITARLVWLQVVKAPEYTAKASSQRMKDIDVPARRGTIYDREGEPLAKSVAAVTVFASPDQVKDKAGTAKTLASVLGGDENKYLADVSSDSGFRYIEHKIDLNRAKALQALKITGIGFLDDSKRVYPSNQFACQVLGFVSIEGTGAAGIEMRYNRILAGTPGKLIGERDPYGRPIPGGVQQNIDPVEGHDIVLTIDKDIQFRAQKELAKAVKHSHAKSGSVVVMNPRTGEIYAMASTPYFNPNDLSKAKRGAFRNQPVSDAYEPGSTIKSLTAAAVIDKGLYTPKSMFKLPPTLTVAGRTIHESHPRGTVNWSLTDIVTESSNVGAVKLGLRLGKRNLYDYFSRFGLTEATGVDFPGEARGWLPNPRDWSASSIANIPFGQGVSATPLQLCRAVSAIANGGQLVTPHFLMDVPQDRAENRTWATRTAISAETASSTTSMLRNVVTRGTGQEAAVKGYSVAGKTGTAQIALPNGGGYRGGYIGSFIGYLPAENPELLICVKIDKPRGPIFGGLIAAPAFSKIAEFSAAHLKIPPSPKKRTGGVSSSKSVGSAAGNRPAASSPASAPKP